MGKWKTKAGNTISIKDMNDIHLDNSIKMLYDKAVKKAIINVTDNMDVAEYKRFVREKKLKRILKDKEILESDYNIIWEKEVESIYWDMIYEKKIRENILFR